MTAAGAGKIFINSIVRDGTYCRYDLELIKKVSSIIDVPLIAFGGAGSLSDFCDILQNEGSAVAAVSYFFFKAPKMMFSSVVRRKTS